jgi:hypothetical protein
VNATTASEEVQCPHCGGTFPLGEALAHRFQESAEAAFRQDLADAEGRIRAEERERLKQRPDLERDDLRRQLLETRRSLKESQAAELELRSRERTVEQREQAFELEVARSRRQLKAEVEKEHEADHQVRIRELEAQVKAMGTHLKEAARKADGGSPQSRGLIRQGMLGEALSEACPDDEVEVIAHGKAGADVRHIVCSRIGVEAARLLWESKVTARWSNRWLVKLKADRARERADLAILVTAAPPPEGPGLHLKGDIWVVDPDTAAHVIHLFRQLVLTLAQQAARATRSVDAASQVYDWLGSPRCAELLERVMASLAAERTALEQERAGMTRHWASRQQAMDSGVEAVALFVAGLQGAGALLDGTLMPLPGTNAGGSVLSARMRALGRGPTNPPALPAAPGNTPTTVKLTCRACENRFEAPARRGRRPVLCPDCRPRAHAS